jgi:methionyl-tRNA synthetase
MVKEKVNAKIAKANGKVSKKSSVKSNLKSNEKVIVTAALPYANGSIHIGHLLEYVQADVYTRFLKSIGKDALFVCASDMHGTPIEMNAKKAGIDPKKFAAKFMKEHQEDFASYLIEFDNYYHTDSKENKELVEYFYSELKKKDLIYTKKMNVIFCKSCKRSLPDRFVKGTCPHCTTADQYGDICESCGITLKGTDLVNPKCSLCGESPTQKESEHYFFKLKSFSKSLEKWFNTKESLVQPEMKNWLNNWIKKGLDDWCISRDEPYYGFEIPDSVKETGEKKYFYVWLDAPIGYISSTKNLVKGKWKDYWYKGHIQHFIGKDIAYFHLLFWPAILMAVDIPLPKLTVHGWVTVNGKKMSKSRGTFFTAKDFLQDYSAESLRFYYMHGLDKKIVDLDLNLDDFKAVTNNVLMGNLGNFCYRTLIFAEKNYGKIDGVADGKDEKVFVKKIEKLFFDIEKYYLKQDFKAVIKNILIISDLGNAYFQKSEVWKDKDSVESKKKVGFCVNLARNLSILIAPVLPEFSEKVWKSLGLKKLLWGDLGFDWKGKLKKVEKLVEKIEVVDKTEEKFPLQMVVGEIKEVENHPNADSLYLMKVDFGKKIGSRQVVAGLKKWFNITELISKKAVFCVNMKPAKLRGELSEGMIFAADDHENVSILHAKKTKVGAVVNFSGLENSEKEVTFDDFLKIKMLVKNDNIYFGDKKLSSKVEDIVVTGVKEGSRVH